MTVSLDIPLGPVTQPTDVVAFGENSLDFVGELGPGAAQGSKRSLNTFALRVGGQMATAAVGVARLGLRSSYIGAFGDDEWGGQVRGALKAQGVNVRAVVRPGIPSRIAVVLVHPDGDRQVLEHRHDGLALKADEVAENDWLAGRVLMVDATSPAVAQDAARLARRHRIPTIVDADRVSSETEALLAAIDVIIVPEPFVIEWAGVYDLPSGLQKMAARYPAAAAIVATRGPEGSVALARGQLLETPGFRVEVADTTGAGDAFRAGFASGWIRLGHGADLGQVLRFANATAALNCRAVGAQAGLPTVTEVEALLNVART